MLIDDTKTGRMKEEVLDEKVLSAIIELKTAMEKIPAFLAALEKVQHRDRHGDQRRRRLPVPPRRNDSPRRMGAEGGLCAFAERQDESRPGTAALQGG